MVENKTENKKTKLKRKNTPNTLNRNNRQTKKVKKDRNHMRFIPVPVVHYEKEVLDVMKQIQTMRKKGSHKKGGMAKKELKIHYYPSYYSVYGKDNPNAVPGVSSPVIYIEKTKHDSLLQEMKSQFSKVDDFIALMTLQNSKMKYPEPLFTETILLGDDSADDFTKRFNKQRYNFIISQKDGDNLKWPDYLPQKTEEEKIDDQIQALEYAKNKGINTNLNDQIELLKSKKEDLKKPFYTKFFSKTNLSIVDYRLYVCLYLLYMALHEDKINTKLFPRYIVLNTSTDVERFYDTIKQKQSVNTTQDNNYSFNSIIINYYRKMHNNESNIEIINKDINVGIVKYTNYVPELYMFVNDTNVTKNSVNNSIIDDNDNIKIVAKDFESFMNNINNTISSLIKEISKSKIEIIETKGNIDKIKFYRYVVIFLKKLLKEKINEKDINDIEQTTNQIIIKKKEFDDTDKKKIEDEKKSIINSPG